MKTGLNVPSESSVADPVLAFQVYTDPDPGFVDQKSKKIRLKQKFMFFYIKNCNLLIAESRIQGFSIES
jgi:hypothetical protein